MAARNRTWTPEKVRQRIQTTMLVKRLTDHVVGKVEMSATQLRAAEILLRKRLPDLSAVEHSGSVEHRRVDELTDSEIAERLERIRAAAGTAEAPASAQEPSPVH